MKSTEKINRNQFMMTSLDDMITPDSNVRVIDAYVQSLDVETLGYRVYTNKVGRPAYNPKDLIGLYLYSYMSKVMSSRMMEHQTYVNLEVMWLLNGAHPDHSTIAAFRSKNSAALTNTFHDFTKNCVELGLVGGNVVSVDGTKLHANNNKKRNFSVKSLTKKIAHIDEQVSEYLSTLDKNDGINTDIQQLESRKNSYQDMLEHLNNSNETQISKTDPDSRLMDNKKGGLDVAYNIQATVDEKNALVIDQYITNAPTDQGELSNATERAQKILSNEALTILADKGYYNGEDLEKCFAMGVKPVVSRQNPPKRTGMYSIDDFIYDKENDTFTCPQNKVLSKISGENAIKTVYANKSSCKNCPYKEKCFKQDKRRNYRRISKDKYFKSMYKADCIFSENKELYHRRQELSEHVFGSIKRQLGFPQLNVRTKQKVAGEVSLLFLGYNLKRVMNIIGNTELIRYFKERTNSKLNQFIRFILKSDYRQICQLRYISLCLNYSTV